MSYIEIEGGHPLNGTYTPSGNKNEALPALCACLLTEEPITLKRMPRIKDVLTVCEILSRLGAEIEWTDHETVVVCCRKIHSYHPCSDLCTHIRASILLLGPLLARFGEVELALPGGDVIGARRIDTHFEGLSQLGAECTLDKLIHAKIKEKSLVTGCAAKPTNKKIPEPIIFPVTIEVASKIPRTLLEFDMN